MAAVTGSSLGGLCEEAICSICLEYFKDPVTIECGHNFCRACLAQSWKGSEGEEASCPQCRKGIRRNLLIPDWQLANLAEKLSRLEGEKAQERNGTCVKHQEPVKLFCQDDETLICVVCDRSKEHRGHQVVPLEEAAPEYQELITNRLELLKKERATIMKYEAEIQNESQDLFDIGSILQKSVKKQTSENPVAFLPELKWKIWDFCDINPLLEGVMNQFKDALLHGLQLQKANVTLDPETAHPRLIVSEDHKSVTYGDKIQDLPDNPQRFDTSGIVLGRERFTAGRHFWEVVVGSEEQWLAGVTRESVERKGTMDWSPKGGILAVGKWGGGYWVTSQPKFTCFSPGDDLKRIRVSLNCVAGRVAFYNADTAAHLYTFSEVSIVGETFLPLFNVIGKGNIILSP